MKFQKVNIATARIRGLTERPNFLSDRGYFSWNITFDEKSILIFINLSFINMGYTETEAEFFCNQIKVRFKSAQIYEGDKVAVIFRDDGRVVAIGNMGEDVWIDTTNQFVKKTFAELNIVITSLAVY